MRMKTLFLLLLLVGVVVSKVCEIYNQIPNPAPGPDQVAPDSFHVKFDTDVLIKKSRASPIILFVNRTWAPLGVDRFYSLVQDGYYNQAAFFRVVPDFVVQFGISASPEETQKWNTNIPDDPVLVSNAQWTVSYATAGPDTRTTQLFINYIDNSRLDDMGFAPFAVVVSGLETALAIYNPTPGDSNGVDQDKYTAEGNTWILTEYPGINMITCASIVDPADIQ